MVGRRVNTVVARPNTIEARSISTEMPGPTGVGHAIVTYSPGIVRPTSATFAIVAADTMPSGFPRRRADTVRVCSPMPGERHRSLTGSPPGARPILRPTSMLRAVAHFLRNSPEVLRLQQQLSRAELLGPGARVEAIEPEQDFLELALAKASRSGGQVHAAAGDGMSLASPDASFDSVVLCLVLCSVPSVERVVSEAFRVLRPGSTLRALEHVRSEGVVGGALMTAVNPLWLVLNKQGCNLDRTPLPRIEAQKPG